MLNYSLSSAIPTKSHSKGLITEPNLVFSNNTSIFSFIDKPIFINTLNYDILSIKHFQNNYLVLTTKKIILVDKKGEILSSFTRTANLIEVSDDRIYLAKENLFEIYSLNHDFKFQPEFRRTVHTNEINFLKRIDDFVFTCSSDKFLLIWRNNIYTRVLYTKSKVINVFIISYDPFILEIVTETGLFYSNLTGFDLEKREILRKDAKFKIIDKFYFPGQIYCASKKENTIYFVQKENEKIKLVFFENQKIKNEIELSDLFYESEILNDELILKNENGIKSFNFFTYEIKDKVDFPEILCMAEERNKIVLGCTDKFLRVYDDTFMFCKIKDEKALGPFFNVYKIKNVIFSITGSGYVSVFDINNNVCFRSFHIECRVSSSAINEDGTLLFLSNFDTNEIYVIDVMRSKKVDVIDSGSPVIKMVMFKSFLYVLSLDSITKYDLYNSTNTSVDFKGNTLAYGECLAASTDKSIYMFDSNLNITSVLDCQLKGRDISEQYNKNKPITKLSFDHLGNVLCSGRVNQVYMLNSSESKKYKVSFNMGLENYKEELGREEDRIFDEKNLIEAKELIHSQSSATFYILSRHTLLIYKAKESKILFDCADTQESAEELYKIKDYIPCLFLALKLNLTEITKEIIRNTFFVPRYSEKLTEKLAEVVVKMTEENDSLDNALVWLREILRQYSLPDDYKNKIRIVLEKIRIGGWNIYKRLIRESEIKNN